MMKMLLQRLFLALTTAGMTLGALAINAAAGEVKKGIYGDVAVMSGFSGDVAIRGYDPVAYFTDGKAVQGSEAYSYKWLGATWWFANDAHAADSPRARFHTLPSTEVPARKLSPLMRVSWSISTRRTGRSLTASSI
jgi:hypothetical protein